MVDCWMSLDHTYATRFAHEAWKDGVKWIEEALSPDDYWGSAALKRADAGRMWSTTGKHEATRWGFRLLLETGCSTSSSRMWDGAGNHGIDQDRQSRGCSRRADDSHGSSVYSYHFAITRHNSPFSEFLMMHPTAEQVVPMFHSQLIGEPVPVNGRLKLSDRPGFGVSSTGISDFIARTRTIKVSFD